MELLMVLQKNEFAIVAKYNFFILNHGAVQMLLRESSSIVSAAPDHFLLTDSAQLIGSTTFPHL